MSLGGYARRRVEGTRLAVPEPRRMSLSLELCSSSLLLCGSDITLPGLPFTVTVVRAYNLVLLFQWLALGRVHLSGPGIPAGILFR